jgi:hypothetical protein
MIKGLRFTLLLLCSTAVFTLQAQNFHLNVGLDMGGSQIFHNTQFKKTPLYDQFEIIQEVYRRDDKEYTWQNFEEDFGLHSSFLQPRFGLSAHLTYKELPFFLIGEAMSSPSGYTKMMYGVTAGVGKDFYTADETFCFTFKGGYKFVWDKGFGSNTLINAVRDDFMRERLAAFFNPTEPLGRQRGNMFSLRLGAGKTLGAEKRTIAGIEFFGELDLVEKSVRSSRMTNMGAQVYMRFRLLSE